MSDRQKPQVDHLMLFSEHELLTAKEVALLTRLPVKSCYGLLGDIAIELAPRTLRWRKSDVVGWLDSKFRGGLAA
jgi:predicted DNA-binding transcriptional regulator AlpA